MQTHEPIAATLCPPRDQPALWRRILVNLREQARFSLATLLEWMAAYTLAFAAAWCRAGQLFTSGILLGLLFSGLCARICLRSEGRRILHYFVFALVISLGVYVGAIVLRNQRIRTAIILVEQMKSVRQQLRSDEDAAKKRETDQLDQQKKVLQEKAANALERELNLGSISKEDLLDWIDKRWSYQWAERVDKIDLHENYQKACEIVYVYRDQYLADHQMNWYVIGQLEKRFTYERNKLSTRTLQLMDEAQALNVSIAPLPAAAEAWSPLLVPADRRLFLRVTADFEDADLIEIRQKLMEFSGISCEFSPLAAQNIVPLEAHVSTIEVCQLFDWICKIRKLRYRYDERAGKVHFDVDVKN